MEPDALVQCPYDRNHQVRVSRLPYHLVRCQQNNPQVSRTLATCPFNARHRVPRGHLRSHLTSCPDRLLLEVPPDPGDTAGDRRTWDPPRAWQPPPCREDWDAELSELELEEPPPFVLNVTKGDLPVPCRSSDPAVPPEGMSPRRPKPATATPKPATATPRAVTATPRAVTATPRAGTATPRAVTATPRAGTARPRTVTAGTASARARGAGRGLGALGNPPASKYFRK